MTAVNVWGRAWSGVVAARGLDVGQTTSTAVIPVASPSPTKTRNVEAPKLPPLETTRWIWRGP
jgi:hypothetical protein